MSPHSQIRWIRPVLQVRSQQTLERLLDSAEELIADKGFEDITVAEIASRAGVSVGAVYSRFHDKQGVLHCLQDRFVDEANLTTDNAFDPERWRGASIEEIISELITFLVEIHRKRRGVMRELVARAKNEPSMIERKGRLVARIGECLESLLIARAERIGAPAPAMAIRFGLRLVLCMLEQAILFDDIRAYGIPDSDEQLASELTRAYLAYLDVNGESLSVGPMNNLEDELETRRE
ncbi:MAG: TetR/AcrR family transcriptional regulator [bacterium]|nr:TetR/AcrR family transcriptional regulator [bacterium]